MSLPDPSEAVQEDIYDSVPIQHLSEISSPTLSEDSWEIICPDCEECGGLCPCCEIKDSTFYPSDEVEARS